MIVIATALLVVGTALLLLAALGVVLLPDALARQHAATKAGTLALTMLCLGALLAAPAVGAGWRLTAIVVLLFVTMPVASHLLARAAAREQYRYDEIAQARRVADDPARRPSRV